MTHSPQSPSKHVITTHTHTHSNSSIYRLLRISPAWCACKLRVCDSINNEYNTEKVWDIRTTFVRKIENISMFEFAAMRLVCNVRITKLTHSLTLRICTYVEWSRIAVYYILVWNADKMHRLFIKIPTKRIDMRAQAANNMRPFRDWVCHPVTSTVQIILLVWTICKLWNNIVPGIEIGKLDGNG